MALTLQDIAKLRSDLYSKKSEYEEDDAMSEFQYNINCLSRAEQLIKVGKSITIDELWDLA